MDNPRAMTFHFVMVKSISHPQRLRIAHDATRVSVDNDEVNHFGISL